MLNSTQTVVETYWPAAAVMGETKSNGRSRYVAQSKHEPSPAKKNAFDQTDWNMLSTPVANRATIMHIYWLQYYDIQSGGFRYCTFKGRRNYLYLDFCNWQNFSEARSESNFWIISLQWTSEFAVMVIVYDFYSIVQSYIFFSAGTLIH